MHLSVVIPVFNEVERIPRTLEEVTNFLDGRGGAYEVIVVDDGSTDATALCVEQFSKGHPQVKVLRQARNRGKGAAVRAGMLAAEGECVLFTDADLSAPISEMNTLLEPLQNGYDVALGSRALRRDLIQVHQPVFRETAGKLFNVALRRVTGLPFRDTQCGFKAFRRAAARRLFSLQSIEGFGFDAEVLFLARKLGYRVLEVPVRWAHREGTKVRVARDGLGMALDLFRIRWNDWSGKYSEIARQPASE